MKELIAFFEYEGTRYYISLLDKKIIFLKSKNNKEIEEKLTGNELKIVKKVYQNITIDYNSSIYIKNINTKDNTYNMFIDKHTHNYFWIPINKEYNIEDNIFLNFKYNHEPELVFSKPNNNQTSELSKFYTKLVKFGKKIVIVLVSATISLTLLNGCQILNVNKNDNDKSAVAIEETKIAREYDYGEIQEAIKNNPHLSEAEKNFIYKLKFIFDDNHQHMDLDLIIERLRTLKINYNDHNIIKLGTYNIKTNEINLIDQNFNNADKTTFIHEFFHVLQTGHCPLTGEISNEFYTKEAMLRLFEEGIIERKFFLTEYELEEYANKLSNETDWLWYFYKTGKFTQNYMGYAKLYCILAEILPVDVLRQYQFNPSDTKVLVNALVNIDNNYENSETYDEKITRAYKLIDEINGLREYNKEANSYNYNVYIDECLELLNYYYIQAKGINIKEDPICCAYLKLNERGNYLLTGKFSSNISDIWGILDENYNVSNPVAFIPQTHLSNTKNMPVLIYENTNKEYAKFELTDEVRENYKMLVLQTNDQNKSK